VTTSAPTQHAVRLPQKQRCTHRPNSRIPHPRIRHLSPFLMVKAPFSIPLSTSRWPKHKRRLRLDLAPAAALSIQHLFLFLFLVYSHSFVVYLFLSLLSTYKYTLPGLASEQATASPFPFSFRVRFLFSFLPVRSIRDNAIRCQPTTSCVTSYLPAVVRLTTAYPPPPFYLIVSSLSFLSNSRTGLRSASQRQLGIGRKVRVEFEKSTNRMVALVLSQYRCCLHSYLVHCDFNHMACVLLGENLTRTLDNVGSVVYSLVVRPTETLHKFQQSGLCVASDIYGAHHSWDPHPQTWLSRLRLKH